MSKAPTSRPASDIAERFASYEAKRVFSVALAGRAWLLAREHGRTDARLPYRARVLDRAAGICEAYLDKVERLVSRKEPQTEPGFPPGTRLPGGFPEGLLGDGVQCNWPVAMSGFFWAEALARGAMRREAKANLRILEATQQEDGGWGHNDARCGGVSGMTLPIPDPTGRHGRLDYPWTLLATSNACAASLAAARRALGKPGGPALAKARAYFAAAQNGDGSFPYDPVTTPTGPSGGRCWRPRSR